MGKHVKITDELFIKIIDRITGGESLRHIFKGDGMPSLSYFLEWLGKPENIAKSEQYSRARARAVDFYAEEIIALAENCQETPEAIAKTRLLIDSIKWVACKLVPKKYGEKIEHTGNIEHFVIRAPDKSTTADAWLENSQGKQKIIDLQPIVVDDKENS